MTSPHQEPKRTADDLGGRTPTNRVAITLRSSRVLLVVFLACALAEAAFFLLDWHVNFGALVDHAPIRNLLNTTREDGLASWFGVTQTALVAATLWSLFLVAKSSGRTSGAVLGWLLLALFFSYMAFDDGTEFHERIGSTFERVQRSASQEGDPATAGSRLLELFPSYAWQVLFLPAFGAMGLFMLVFLWREFGARFPRSLLVAGLACFAIAVGLDFIEGLDEDHALNLYRRFGELAAVDDYTASRFGVDGYSAVRHFAKSLEETLEMFGMTLLWLAFLAHGMVVAREFRLNFR